MLAAISRFFDSVSVTLAVFLEREAGYQIMSLVLIVFGVWIADPKTRESMAHDLLVFGLGVMARSMGSKRQQMADVPVKP